MSQIGNDMSVLGEVVTGSSDPTDPAAITAMHAASVDLLSLSDLAESQAATAVANTTDADVIEAIEALGDITLRVARFMGESARDAADLTALTAAIYGATDLFQEMADLDAASYGAVLKTYGETTCATDATGTAGVDPETADAAAKTDAQLIGNAMEDYYVDGQANAVIALDGETYTLNGTAIGARSANVTVTAQWATGPTAWCVEVTNPHGAAKTFNFSSANGLGAGACAAQ